MQIHGSKKQKGGSQKPNIQKDTTASTNFFQGLYGLSEGEIYGLVDGGKSIKLDGTPIINDNGQPNFENITWDFRNGTIDQEHIKGFSSVENESSVNVELRHDRPYTKALTNTQLSAVAVRLAWNALREQKDNGDIVGYRIEYAIDVQTDGGAWATVLNTAIHDKASQGYQRSHRIDLPKAKRGWVIRVRRITPNRDSDLISDGMSVSAITEIIDAKLRYPCTALLALKYDAETFSNIAKVAVRLRGLLIQVPTNYDPTTRQYNGLWDGTFKLAYSNNPAWVFYDICTAKRYGLGERLAGKVDKWALYQLGQYCDELVDDGKGGKEPRFTVNVYIQKAEDAYQVLQNLASVFRALSYWDGTNIIVDADTPKEPVYTFTNANVVGGAFSYTGTRARDRHTVVKCGYDDPENGFETDYIFVRDEYAIAKYGNSQLDLNVFGCTSQGQAQRAGLWALQSEQLETETVTFKTGLDGFIPKVGEIIQVMDNHRAGRMQAGRIVGVNGKTVTLDRTAGKVGDEFIVQDKTAKIVKIDGVAVTLDKAIGTVGQVFAISADDLAPRAYRVMTISQNDDATFSFTALQYEIGKFTATDTGVRITPKPVSVIKAHVLTPPNSVNLTANTRTVQGQAVTTLSINWEQVQGAVAYIVEWRKDDNAWQSQKIASQSLDIDGVYAGNYQARVRAVDAFDNESLTTSSPITAIAGKQGKPPKLARLTATGQLFGMALAWVFNAGSDDTNYTEIQVSPDGRANITTLGTFAYPTNKHEITGLQGNLTQYYRARIVDKLGNASDWTAWVSGTTSANADKVLDLISGQINESHLNQTLRTPIAKIGSLETNVNNINGKIPTIENTINSEKTKLAQAIKNIDSLTADKNAKTQEIANLTQTVGGHTSSIRELGVTTGELSQKYTQLKSASDNANSEIVAIKQTTANQAIEHNKLSAKFDSLSVGGRNYLQNSDAVKESSSYQLAEYHLTKTDFKDGDKVVVTIWGQLGDDRTHFGAWNSGGWYHLGHFTQIGDGVHRAFIVWRDGRAETDPKKQPSNDKLRIYQHPSTNAGISRIDRIKLEIGNIATDWTPAPEDLQSAIDGKASTASLDEFKQTSANADSALSERISAIDTAYKSADTQANAKLGTLEKSLSDKEKALSERISAIDTAYKSADNNLTSRIASEEQARASGDTANAQKISQLESNLGTKANATALNELTTRVSTAEGKITAETQKLSTLQTTVNGQTSSIQTIQSSVNGMKSEYAVKVDSGGRVAGFGLMGSSSSSEFAVVADKFYIAPPSGSGKGKTPFSVLTSPRTINGVTVPAGTYIDSAFIQNGSITNAHIANASISSAKIQDGSITTAKIGTAQVDTLQIKGEAVVIPRAQSFQVVREFDANTTTTLFGLELNALGNAVLVSAFLYGEFDEGSGTPSLQVLLMRGDEVIFSDMFSELVQTPIYDSKRICEDVGESRPRITCYYESKVIGMKSKVKGNFIVGGLVDRPPSGNTEYRLIIVPKAPSGYTGKLKIHRASLSLLGVKR